MEKPYNYQNKLIQFINQQHQLLLDDHIHIITKHNTEMHSFRNQTKFPCSTTDCESLRQSNNELKITPNDETDDFDFHRDILDSVHCYLYHEYNNKNNKRNKFTINSQTTNESDTMFGELYEYLMRIRMDTNKVKSIMNVLLLEEYDSETLIYDVESKNGQNIAQLFPDCYGKITEFVTSKQASVASFNIGYRFYYWTYYKSSLVTENEYFQNRNDHSGYKPHELYIKKKYPCIKDEIL
eukprot:227208_1